MVADHNAVKIEEATVASLRKAEKISPGTLLNCDVKGLSASPPLPCSPPATPANSQPSKA